MSDIGNIFLNQKLGAGFYLKRLFKKTNLRGFVLHLGSSTNLAVKYLSSFKDIICVDVDEDYMQVLSTGKNQELLDLKSSNKNAYNNIIRPIIKNYVNSIRKIYNTQTKYIILISSNGDLLEYIGVREKYNIVLMPENGMKIDLSTEENVKSREEANRSKFKKFEYRTETELHQLFNFLLGREKIISL